MLAPAHLCGLFCLGPLMLDDSPLYLGGEAGTKVPSNVSGNTMLENLIKLSEDSELNLQAQLRQQIVTLVAEGLIPNSQRLPSSRRLADSLGISRNTAVLAYQQLIDEGYLVSRERSGIYVSQAVQCGGPRLADGDAKPAVNRLWRQRLAKHVQVDSGFPVPPQWQDYPYPFLEGEFDQSLFPVAEWREASRLSLGVREINDWSRARGDADDPQLIEQIRTKILPRRGISARPDEILITNGAQQGLFLLANLLFDVDTCVAMEEPGYPDFRELVTRAGSELEFLPVDTHGIDISKNSGRSQFIYVTPSHQVPTTVTLSSERRTAMLGQAAQFDQIIIEDDFDSETNFLGNPHPSLKSQDREGRVIYIGSLSKVISAGLRLGFMIAPAELIEALRHERRYLSRFPAANNQRTAAFFLSLGHFDATMRRLHQTFKDRWIALRNALNHYLPRAVYTMESEGGTCCWVQGPAGLQVEELCRQAEMRGILIEPVAHFYGATENHSGCFRLGVSSLPVEKIRPGIAKLAALIRELSGEPCDALDESNPQWFTNAELTRALAGARLLTKTVYGQPLTIDLLADGRMVGHAGFANEEQDEGRWWVADDRFYRQWQTWSYGEAMSFYTVVEQDQVRWYDHDHRFIDSAIMRHQQAKDTSAVQLEP
ncbi:PLP-dependent aminotransferase family protein [Simiduia aestuariiviva]|uniref:GntR family transcriptional regulator/MocR family aminotransferase n=1 Tax=Simiduia aestuariiviva TaxID=1510459 RepID=A0A839UMG4_9GAMM|nr:PLP-dependent aminotransferase family protein [Simiduia aestuariiviva]MBB3167750.1 GntR family transcriptional regulator/MocR family aminotransferase [Simiduia aestuariiviva]